MDADDVVRLRRAIARLSRQLNASATGAGLTPTQASVLALIAGHGPVGIAELIHLEGINPTMLSRVLGKLEDAELIVRQQSAGDQRSATAQITETGRRTHERIKHERATVVSRCVAQLEPSAAEALRAALPALEQLAALLAQ